MRGQRRRQWAWLAALVPTALGVALALLVWNGKLPNPVLRAWTDLGTLLLAIGLLVSGVTLPIAASAALFQQRLEQMLAGEQEQAAEAHRRFILRLDHELKNPLTAIRVGLANLAVASSETERQDVLTTVGEQAERLGRLSADLRKLAELETKLLEQTAVDVAELLQEAVELARQQPAIAERSLALSMPRAPWPLPAVRGDRDLLFLAVYNLLDNALKFTHPGDTLEVRAFEDEATVLVEVADTGPGVLADDLPHIFEELYRGQGAQGEAGSGLGLALVKAVIERHGGSVTVRSRPGQGSVFTVRLPVD